MSRSYTTNESETFTFLHARYIASKVATDLRRFQRFYNGVPSTARIESYEKELAVLLKYDVVESVVYGFKRNGKWTEASVRYTALPGGTLIADDDPGKIRPNLDVAGATFTSFVTYNSNWSKLTSAERAEIEEELPFTREDGETPPLEAGYWMNDRSYSAAGEAGLFQALAERGYRVRKRIATDRSP
jgi:hypothetical protein